MNIVATQMVMAAAEMEPRLFDLDMQLLSDAVLMIIAVFALFLIASHSLFNPVRNMMQSRQDRIKSELDTAAADMAQAKALKEEYETKLREINKEAEEILGEARKKALAVKQESHYCGTLLWKGMQQMAWNGCQKVS